MPPPSALPAMVSDTIHYIEEMPTLTQAFQHEIAMESALHVNGYQWLQCEAQFGFPEFIEQAPPLDDLDAQANISNVFGSASLSKAASALWELGSTPSLQAMHSFGACLATPTEADTGSRAVSIVRATTSAYHVHEIQEEVVRCVDRWGDWVRRIRRKRRLEQMQALLSILDAPGSALKRTLNLSRDEDYATSSLDEAEQMVEAIKSNEGKNA